MIDPYAWRVAIVADGFQVVRHGGDVLRQRWIYLNHRGRPGRGLWCCGSRRLVFTDYRKAVRTAKRLNKRQEPMRRARET
jgi:hypothetical protein